MDETGNEPEQPSRGMHRYKMWVSLALLLMSLLLCTSGTEACSSRLRNRKRPPTTPAPPLSTPRPTVTYDICDCPPLYQKWYCVNEARCFAIRVGDHLEYNCNCTEGFMGRRCELKYVDVDIALLSQQQSMLETAGLAGSLTYICLLAIAIGLIFYLRRRRRQQNVNEEVDQVDGVNVERLRPFGPRTVDIPLERLVKKKTTLSSENGTKSELV